MSAQPPSSPCQHRPRMLKLKGEKKSSRGKVTPKSIVSFLVSYNLRYIFKLLKNGATKGGEDSPPRPLLLYGAMA